MRARVAIAALASVGLLFVAGCGSGEKNDYIDAFNKIQLQFQKDVTKATKVDASSGISGFKSTLTGIAKSVDKTSAKLEDLEPPDEVKTQHDNFVKALDDYSSSLSKAAKAIDSDDPQATIDASSALLDATTAVSEKTSKLTDEINTELHK
jgi:hypothetical protein